MTDRRNKIIEILENELPRFGNDVRIIDSIVDNILALPLDVPTKEEIHAKAMKYVANEHYPVARSKAEALQLIEKFMLNEIIKRNK
jgi:hypothetical protein